jgi:hypothetical protein
MMRCDPICTLVVGGVLILLVALSRWLWRGGQVVPESPIARRVRRKQGFAPWRRRPARPHPA